MTKTANDQKTTVDALLGGRIMLEQPAVGYRVAVDTLLLAAAVSAQAGERVLDMGCGVGGVMLALAARVPGIRITGIEIQSDFADLCRRNIERNERQKTLSVHEGDGTNLPAHFCGFFDHVVMNPPFHDAVRHDGSPHVAVRKAKRDAENEMEAWLCAAFAALKDGGVLTMICRADRQEEIIKKAGALFGAFMVKRIQTKPDGTCKRFILRGVKGCAHELTVYEPFVLCAPEADVVLREAQALPF